MPRNFAKWVAFLILLAGCSREVVQRTTYETLRNIEQQQCLDAGTSPCPPREGYDAYQRRREELQP